MSTTCQLEFITKATYPINDTLPNKEININKKIKNKTLFTPKPVEHS